MNDELTTRLSRQLHDQVDGPSSDDEMPQSRQLPLEGVQGRARTIRRRRQAMTSGVVAAAVLAVAIPAGFGLASRTDSTPDYTNPSPTRVADDAPTPRADGTFPLATLDAPEGPAPGTGVIRLADSTLVTAGGEQQLPEGTVQIERFGDGWLALQAGEDVPGGTRLLRLDADRQVVEQVSAAGLVVDAAGEHAAWIEVDGGAWILAQATPDRALGSLSSNPTPSSWDTSPAAGWSSRRSTTRTAASASASSTPTDGRPRSTPASPSPRRPRPPRRWPP